MSVSNTILRAGQDWQSQLRDVVTSRKELLTALGLSEEAVGNGTGCTTDFPLKVPRGFVQRMRPGDPDDPLLRQVLSSPAETVDAPGYVQNPLGECGDSIPGRGIIHKYHGRVLLIVSGGCAVHCRYCFRRHFPYEENRNSREQWRSALDYIREDSAIEEVILSGGDPLVVTDDHLHQLVDDIVGVKHVSRLRLHSRLPIVLPGRITRELLGAITHPDLQTVMVVHCNHANEIDDSVVAAIDALRQRGITVLNQAVLLRGVNDTLDAQLALARALFNAGILPYYLHLLDKVQGAAHFDVPESRARTLMYELAARLPGYMMPKLARELPGERAKRVIQAGMRPTGD